MFLLFVFFAGSILGNLAYTHFGGTVPTLGASGGVAALMAYYGLKFANHRIRVNYIDYLFLSYRLPGVLELRFSAFTYMVLFFLFQGAFAWIPIHGGMSHGGINYMAHIGGGVVGLIAYLLFRTPS